MIMLLVSNRADIIENMKTIDHYLDSKIDPEYSYALERVKRGTCFVKYNDRFYPSRFIGYKSNTMDKHENNEWKDGKETNPKIGCILGKLKPDPNERLNKEYQAYCKSLGFEAREKGAFGVERKFWECN